MFLLKNHIIHPLNRTASYIGNACRERGWLISILNVIIHGHCARVQLYISDTIEKSKNLINDKFLLILNPCSLKT